MDFRFVPAINHVVHLDFWGNPLQMLVWVLLIALVSVKISLPPAINVRLVSVTVWSPWVRTVPSPWLILAWILSVILATAGAWVFAAAWRSFCHFLRFSDDTRADFSGRGGQVLARWILWILAGPPMGPGWEGFLVDTPLYFLGLWATLNGMRWFVAHVELSSGQRFSFLGATYRTLFSGRETFR